MIILGIETSCDETGAAILSKGPDGIKILSNVLASSAKLQAKYGGIIPEQAAREQVKLIIPVIQEALSQAFPKSDLRHQISELDTIAVTQGPGLIGSLLVGVETAKTLGLVWNKPLIPVNHLIGHFYANWIGDTPKFPILGLLVSGGHTELIFFKNHKTWKYLGGTRDDAAGECFDKCARLLGLPYPGGPKLSKLAKKGNPKAYKLPRPMSTSDDLDFSFSGLKTAVANLVMREGVTRAGAPHRAPAAKLLRARTSDGAGEWQDPEQLANLCASIEAAIVDSLVNKVIKAIQIYETEHLMIAGGVAANEKLIQELRKVLPKISLYAPKTNLCTDNAAMIASRAFFQKPLKNPLSLEADPNLSLSP